MPVIFILNDYSFSEKKIIRWCQDHAPHRWSRHFVESQKYPGMYEVSKTAYRFESKKDALLFKIAFPVAVRATEECITTGQNVLDLTLRS